MLLGAAKGSGETGPRIHGGSPSMDIIAIDYQRKVKETEKAIDKTMARYWSSVKHGHSTIARDYLLRDADKLVRELEHYREKAYTAQASQGVA